MPNEEVKLKPCPKCGGIPRLSVSRQGRGRKSYSVYGYICSNKDCPKSYAYTVYDHPEAARIEWNRDVEWENRINEYSERLERCPCGGGAKIVCERYDERKFWFVRCKQCGRSLSAYDVLDAIIEAWNRRAKNAE